MKNQPINPIFSRDGAAPILVVMLVTLFTSMLLGAYIYSSIVHRRVNTRATYVAEARNAAEGVAEYAEAEIVRRAKAFSNLTTNPLAGYSLDPGDTAFLSPENPSTHVSTDPLAHVVQSTLEYKCGNLSPRAMIVLDGSDPVNAEDPYITQTVGARTGHVFAKASTRDASGAFHTQYLDENIQIREQSWLNYAVFYNMDMEFHAGPNFSIRGPVHTNANIYLVEGSGAIFNCYSPMTARGKIYRLLKYNNTLTYGSNTFDGSINLISSSSGLDADLRSMSTTDDSRRSGWLSYARARWNSYVQDVAFGVPLFAPDGMPTYTPDDFTTTAVNELRNNAWLLIEPQLCNDTNTAVLPMYPNGRYGQKRVNDTTGAPDPNAPENLKLSALAGLIIKVEPITNLSSTGAPKWKLCFPVPTDPTNPVNKANLPTRNADGTPVLETMDPFGFDDTDTTQPVLSRTITRALKNKIRQAIFFARYKDGGTTGSSWGNGTSALDSTTYADSVPSYPAGGAATVVSKYAIYDRREGYNHTTNAWDQGTKGAFHLLRIDMGLLNTLIRTLPASAWVRPSDGKNLSPATCWSGVVYVELPTGVKADVRFPPTTANGDMIRPALPAGTLDSSSRPMPGYAVAVENAAVLPRLDQDLSKRGDGFTIATNGPLYIVGNYNADGNSATGSDSDPDTVALTPTATSEIPAMIAADAVTCLSSGWDVSDFQNSATTKPSASSFTEISAAIITGLVPTQPGASDPIWSGGVHNLVRFLESWSGSTYRYRGSLCAIYESEVAKAKWYQDRAPWYNPPTRDMGYHSYFAQGWFPPGTPIKRSVRRLNIRDIPQSEYDAGPPTDPSP